MLGKYICCKKKQNKYSSIKNYLLFNKEIEKKRLEMKDFSMQKREHEKKIIQLKYPKIYLKNIDFNKLKNGTYCGKKFYSIKKQDNNCILRMISYNPNMTFLNKKSEFKNQKQKEYKLYLKNVSNDEFSKNQNLIKIN